MVIPRELVVNGSMSAWTSLTNSVIQGFILGSRQFNVFINDIDGGIKCTLRKFADDTELSGAVDASERQDGIQRDIDKLRKWAHGNFIRFHKIKCSNFVGAIPTVNIGWGRNRWRAILWRTWGCWWVKSQRKTCNVCLQPSKPNVSQTSSKAEWPVERGKGFCYSKPL